MEELKIAGISLGTIKRIISSLQKILKPDNQFYTKFYRKAGGIYHNQIDAGGNKAITEDNTLNVY